MEGRKRVQGEEGCGYGKAVKNPRNQELKNSRM
jgi:hypothetical protein